MINKTNFFKKEKNLKEENNEEELYDEDDVNIKKEIENHKKELEELKKTDPGYSFRN